MDSDRAVAGSTGLAELVDFQPSPLLRSLYDARDQQEIEESRLACEASLFTFIQQAWHVLRPDDPFISNWHIEAMCEKFEYCTRDPEGKRIQVWVPPGTSKSSVVSIYWPAWVWTQYPSRRFWTASYATKFAGRLSALSREVMMSGWYEQRWGHKFNWLRDAESYFANDRGGTRLATSWDSEGTGEHGHFIIVDDPISANEADATSSATLNKVNGWYDSTVSSRSVTGFNAARVLVMQRLHHRDLAAHLLDLEEWDVLALPERYWPTHPFVWPDDPRTEDGELLWPKHRDEKQSDALARSLQSRAAGQLQQWPTPREGDIIKRDWWRFYDYRIRSEERWGDLPKFRLLVVSVDCPQKDKQTNDNVAIQCWGVTKADRYLLDLRLGKMNYNLAKRQVTEMSKWARRTWRTAMHYVLIENGGYGPEMIIDLKREFTGVTKISPQSDGDKQLRAESATDSLEFGNTFVPGFGPPWQPGYDEAKTPEDVADLIENFARFPNAAHDDDVDAWSQAMNWLKTRTIGSVKTGRA